MVTVKFYRPTIFLDYLLKARVDFETIDPESFIRNVINKIGGVYNKVTIHGSTKIVISVDYDGSIYYTCGDERIERKDIDDYVVRKILSCNDTIQK